MSTGSNITVLTWNLKFFGKKDEIGKRMTIDGSKRIEMFKEIYKEKIKSSIDIIIFQEVSDSETMKEIVGNDYTLLGELGDDNFGQNIMIFGKKGKVTKKKSKIYSLRNFFTKFKMKPNSGAIDNLVGVSNEIKEKLKQRTSLEKYLEDKGFGLKSNPNSYTKKFLDSSDKISYGRPLVYVVFDFKTGSTNKEVHLMGVHLKSVLTSDKIIPNPSIIDETMLTFLNQMTREAAIDVFLSIVEKEITEGGNKVFIIGGDMNTSLVNESFTPSAGDKTFEKLLGAGFKITTEGQGSSYSTYGRNESSVDFDHIAYKASGTGTTKKLDRRSSDNVIKINVFDFYKEQKENDLVIAEDEFRGNKSRNIYYVKEGGYKPPRPQKVKVKAGRVLTSAAQITGIGTQNVTLQKDQVFNIIGKDRNKHILQPIKNEQGFEENRSIRHDMSYLTELQEEDVVLPIQPGLGDNFKQVKDRFAPFYRNYEKKKKYYGGDEIIVGNIGEELSGIWRCRDDHISIDADFRSNEEFVKKYRNKYWYKYYDLSELGEAAGSHIEVSDHDGVICTIPI